MNVELLLNRLIRDKIVTGPHDPQLRRREFEIDEWNELPPALKDYFCIVSPRQVDQVLAEICLREKGGIRRKGEVGSRPGGRAAQKGMNSIPADTELGVRINEAVDAFAENYPQYVSFPPYGQKNYDAMMAKLKELGTYADDYNGLVRAFEELVLAGKLYINLEPLGLGNRIVTGCALKTCGNLEEVISPVRKMNRIDIMSAKQFKEYNNKLDRENGVKKPMSPRAAADAEKMFKAWFDATPGYGVFENQSRARVKELIFEHLTEEDIAWSTSAIANAAEYLHSKGVLFRESDVHSGQRGEFTAPGTRLIVYPKSVNPLTSAPPPPQPVEITDNKVRKFTLAQIRAMSATEYAERIRNPRFVRELDALFNQ